MGQSKLKLHETAAQAHPPAPEDEGLSSFAAESEPARKAQVPAVQTLQSLGSSRNIPYVAAAFGALLIFSAVTVAFVATRPARSEAPPSASAAPLGNAIIDSRPPGAAIFIDGIAQGATPLKVVLPAGQHTLELKLDAASRSFALNVEAGTTVSHYVELAASSVKPAVSTGHLEVASDPPGAQVMVNGAAKGRTPLNLAEVQPGEHSVAITDGTTTVNRRVSVTAGNTATVFASLGAANAAAGWVTFKSPVDLQIFEAKRLVGSTAADRLMLPAGRHDLELVNTELEFRRAMTVQVSAGSTVTAAVDLPNGTLSVNALPWAEVTIGGKPVGTTPLGNLSLPIGSHEVVWRHPQLGERRRTVKVTATTPVRVGVDLSQ
jgi:hypothetical protein